LNQLCCRRRLGGRGPVADFLPVPESELLPVAVLGPTGRSGAAKNGEIGRIGAALLHAAAIGAL